MINETADREKTILSMLADEGSLAVGRLAQVLGVSEVTIRSDLKELEERGVVLRTRGGVMASHHPQMGDRLRERLPEKTRIARAAAELVRDGDVIMIEAGSTTALMVRFLVGKRDVHVVTNSTLVFNYARANPALQVTMTGGEFRRSTESLVGPIALETIARLNVRLAFVGTDGFTLERGMTTHLFEGAEIVKAMKAHAASTVLVADSTKYGKTGFVSVLGLSDVNLIITDSELAPADAAILTESGIQIRTV